MVTEELLSNSLTQLMSYEDMLTTLEDISKQSKTAKLWVDCLIQPVLLMMLFVRAEREGDWPLHLWGVNEMLPFFFAAGHFNYARY